MLSAIVEGIGTHHAKLGYSCHCQVRGAMIRRLGKNHGFNKLLLVLFFSLSMMAVLFYGLARETEAGPREPFVETSRENNHSSLLDYQTGVSTVCEQTKPLVPNWNFEDGICSGPGRCCNHWCCGTEGSCTCEESPGYNSGTSVGIFADGAITEAFALYTPTWDFFPVEPGRVYDYSAWIKTVLSPGSAYLRFTFWNSSGEYVEEHKSVIVTDTQGAWVKVTGSNPVPLGAVSARVECVVSPSSRGWAWFDDIFWGLATCLEISKNSDPASVEPGQVLTYTIVYKNTGREKATNVEIIEDYDKYVDFQWADPNPFTHTTNLWRFPELPPGISDTITVVMTVENDTEERAWLLNGVQILSDETVEPIYTTITTSVDGNGCDFVLYIPDAENPGNPGYPTDYILTLQNAGKCDGQADLVATSSQGWEVTITPPPPYNLPSGSSREVMVIPVVPQCELSGTMDVTLITATLECGLPCSKSVTRTRRVTTTVTRQVGVDIEPDTVKPPPASGTTVIFAHTVTNTGNWTDTFALTHDFPGNATVNIVPSWIENLEPCRPEPVTVTIGNLASDTEFTGTIRATSMSDSREFDEIIDEIKLWWLHLPLTMKYYCPPFCNGDFETNNFACWGETGQIRRTVIASGEDAHSCFNSHAARLGDPSYSNTDVPQGRATIYQCFIVPSTASPKLMFSYCMYSYDHMQGAETGKYYDTLEVAINTIDNIVWRTGNPEDHIPSSCRPSPWNSDQHTQTIDLQDYAGSAITVFFSVWNRQGRECNTWAYIDNIQIVP